MATIEQLQSEAWSLSESGRWAEAIPPTEQALRLMEEESGSESLDVANVSSDLAVCYERISRYEEAIAAARRSLAILAAHSPFTECIEELATIQIRTHAVLSMALRAVGRFPESREEIRNSVRVSEQYLGDSHSVTGSAYCGLGVFCKFSGEFDEAEKAYRKSIAILTPICGEESEDLATLYHNLGGLEHSRGNFAAGIPWARRAYELRLRLLGLDHPDTVADAVAMAGLLDELGPTDESEAIYRHALEVWEKHFGAEHYEIATTLHNLAALRRDRGDLHEAITLFRRAHAMKLNLLGAVSPDTALSAACLAQLLAEVSEHRPEAARMAREALSAYEANCEPAHPDRLACMQLVAALSR